MPSVGKHCITTALKQVLEYKGYKLSEEMLFGIGSGLYFVYVNLAKAPMISGRVKPFVFESVLGERLGIDIKCKSSAKYQNAFNKTKKLIDSDNPVLIYADMPYLDYLNLDEDSHFGGHAVVVFGYDDEEKKFYVSDRDNSDYPVRTPKGDIASDYHLVGYKSIERARTSKHRPFPANNKYLEIVLDEPKEITCEIIYDAIIKTCDNMLDAPAKLLGLNGIYKFSKEVLKWKQFDDDKLRASGVSNYFMISADGGTGGGIFRRMYGDFLVEASEIVKSADMKTLGQEYCKIAEAWDNVGDILWKVYESCDRALLGTISSLIQEIHARETEVLSRLREIVNK